MSTSATPRANCCNSRTSPRPGGQSRPNAGVATGRLEAVKTSTPSSSIEDYVKVIYSFTEWQDKPITSTQLAQRLGVANSSVSEMVRKLKDQGLVDHKPYSAITLTDAGVRLALSMVRRHRLIETYLVQQLGYSWDEIHD